MSTTNEKNIATILHLSALTQYIFPIVIWSSKKEDSAFINSNGKNVLNFQLSIFIYSVVLGLIAIPIFIYTLLKNISSDISFHNHDFIINHFDFRSIDGIAIIGIIALLLFCFLKITEFILIIHAAVKVSNGEEYKYPLSIPFIK